MPIHTECEFSFTSSFSFKSKLDLTPSPYPSRLMGNPTEGTLFPHSLCSALVFGSAKDFEEANLFFLACVI